MPDFGRSGRLEVQLEVGDGVGGSEMNDGEKFGWPNELLEVVGGMGEVRKSAITAS